MDVDIVDVDVVDIDIVHDVDIVDVDVVDVDVVDVDVDVDVDVNVNMVVDASVNIMDINIYLKSWGRPVSRSGFITKWINVLGVLLCLAIIGFGIWLATRPGDCEKDLTVPVFVIGAIFLLISVLGFVGAWFALVPILYSYLVLMLLLLLTLVGITIFVFAVTAPGGGYTVSGVNFQEYRLSDYSKFVQNKAGLCPSTFSYFFVAMHYAAHHALNKQSNWDHIKACIEASSNCADFSTISAANYPSSDLNPIQSGCCRPPAECGFAILGPGNFGTSSSPQSSNPDCLTYSNAASTKCYDCDSCKGGVAQELKKDGKVGGITTLAIFVILVFVFTTACAAGRRNKHFTKGDQRLCSTGASLDHYGRVCH